MASRTKKAASDTVTFTKKELIEKARKFLEDNAACDGDWLNKVKVEFLGQKEQSITVHVMVPATYTFDMACDGTPSKEEVAEFIRNEMEQGDFNSFDSDESEFEVVKVEAHLSFTG